MIRSEVSERLSRAARSVIETLEHRQLLAANPAASVSASLLAFNAIAWGYGGSSPSPAQVITLTNVGGTTLSIPPGGITLANDPAVSSADAGDFDITNLGSVPGTLAPGQSANLDLTFSAQSPGLHSAFLQIQTNDPVSPVEKIALRGLGTTGTGGGNEPSLAAILREYEIPTIVGDGPNDSNAFASTFYPATPDPSSQEVAMQRLVKAGSGPVTIQLLGSFDVSNQPALRFGTYVPGDPADKTELFTINQPDSQSVDPTAQGATRFDPGSNEFGLYTNFPTFTDNGQQRVSYSEDALNTWDANVPRKIRFFPLENANGTVVPNAYVFAAEDNNIPYGNIQPYDSNDLVGIIRNVTAAPGAPNGAVLGLTNLSGVPSSTQLVFNRIQNPNPADPSGFTDIVHDTNTLQINNTGNQTLVISGMSLSDTANWQIVNPPSYPLYVAPGGTADVTIKFVAQTDPPHSNNQTNDSQTTNGLSPQAAGGVWDGTLTISSNDADRPTRTVNLSGYWQAESENENEPGLQTLINSLYGYKTNISDLQEPNFPNNGSQPTLYGEEVASGLWETADPTLPVTVRQLDAFHNQFSSGTEPATLLGWYAAGNSGSVNWLFQQQPGESQSLLPTIHGSNTAPAQGSFTASGAFGFNIDGEASQDSLNTTDISLGRSGHAVRFYPVRDATGKLVPNQWLMVMDYENSQYDNSDFQDNVYLVSNIHPQTQAPAPADAQAVGTASGVVLQWQPVVDSALQGYNVYVRRGVTPTYGYTKLNSAPITAASFLDTGATPGQTNYYMITAVDSSGESEAANPTAVLPAAGTTTVTLGPTGDAYVQDGTSANTNFGSAPDLQVKVSDPGYNHESYISFDLSSYSAGSISGATLRLYGELETAGTGYTVNVLPTSGSWSESSITWNTKPADGSPVIASTTVSGTTGQWYTLDLTSYIQSQLAAGHTIISLAIKGAAYTTGGYADFNSREASSNTPQLVLTVPQSATAPATASFVRSDTTTQGNWSGVYGADGYDLLSGPSSLPSYAQVSTNGNLYVWQSSTTDTRAPQTAPGSTSRIASCAYSSGRVGGSFNINVNLTDGKTHQVGLYLLDWDSAGRTETVQITDAASGAVLSTQNISNFSNGDYLVWNLSGNVNITVTCTASLNAVASGLFFGPVPAATTSSASFIKSDTTTSGNWTSAYGSDGYNVFNEATSLPAYAQVTPINAQAFTWANPTSDSRALLDAPGSSARAATCYYTAGRAGSSFSLDVNLTDGNTHQVALYLLDWDTTARTETVQITDASSGAVLNTQNVSNFSSGTYLVWNLTGHVKITVTCTAGLNGVASGLFFGGPVAGSSATASFLKADTTTSGTWSSTYGADGYSIVNDATNLPSYAQVTASNGVNYTWAASTPDARALQTAPGSSSRIASCYYAPGGVGASFSYDVNLTDGKTHQVGLYLLDWDAVGRVESVQITDASTGAVLSTQSVSNFSSGTYLVWNLSGHVKITVTCTGGMNAVASGLFFGGPPSSTSATASFVKSDTTTSGTWTGSYGSDGYSIFDGPAALPSYAQLSATGANSYIWQSPSTDPRTLQTAPGASTRIASCYYTSGSAGSIFTLNLNLTDGKTHQVALYLLDYDNLTRAETIQITDAATGAVLSTQSASNFYNGDYLVWNLSGNLKITVTCTGYVNAVVSGIFFGPPT